MEIIKTEKSEQFLSGGGEMGELIRSMDWSETALGPVELWPQSLRTSVSLCLSSTFPILIAWGPETIQIYNDSYRPICGAKHPVSMGQSFKVCWETALPVVGDAFDRGQQGEGTYIKDQCMFLDRYGYLEEAFMTFSFAPIRDESGGVGGIFHPITETTDKMLSARRTQILRDLGAAIGKAKKIEEIGIFTDEKYADFMSDLPFLLMYKLDPALGKVSLISASGLSSARNLCPEEIDLTLENGQVWPFQQVLANGESVVLNDLEQRFGTFSCGPYPEVPLSAVLLPLRVAGQDELFGFLVAGVSSRLALDESYRGFYDLLGNTYNTAVSNIYAYEQEQKRAEALAAIDRSKTAFFGNVSHEFRTPLTLMLGPLEDLLDHESLQQPQLRESVSAVHRNALRLLKLVNNLLDFSRVEAGRVAASYEEVDLSELTADLASSFRSIIEKAGMRLVVNCQVLKDPIYADPQMWEKILLNLLSNAFKYTLKGTITISLQQQGQQVILTVADTGVGIPEKEIPHMFERFHRIENSLGRTHEGTGIGLSLVSELVNLHKGHITVHSTEGLGSVFTVTLPVGRNHLPQDQVFSKGKAEDSSSLKGAFLKEALSLLDNGAVLTNDLQPLSAPTTFMQEDKASTILVVDDNSDMRAYLCRLLEPYFTVDTATNGFDALNKVKRYRPALILTDIMMPVMNGKVLLQKLKEGVSTSSIPVIFLSARAGEEARIDGLEAGADDYLVKPFSSQELLIKIRMQIKIARVRKHTEQQLKNLFIDAPVAIAMYKGPQYIIEVANDKMLTYWGKTAAEVLYKPLFEGVPEITEQGYHENIDRVYQTGERFISPVIPIRLLRYGQLEMVYVKVTLEAMREEYGAISGIMEVAHDVTEMVTSGHKVEEAEERVRLATESLGIGVWDVNLKSSQIVYTPRLSEIFGHTISDEFSLSTFFGQIYPEDTSIMDTAFAQAMRGEKYGYECRIIWPDGSLHWISVSGTLFSDVNGPQRMIGITLDITDRKIAEASLLERDDMLRLAIDSAEMGTWSFDPLTNLIKSSPRTKELFGLKPDEELTLEKKSAMIDEADRDRVQRSIIRALAHDSGGHYDEEYKVIHKYTQQERWLRATGKTTFNADKQPIRFAGTVVDFTDRKLDEIRKNDFIAMASHELKTPLTSIKGYIQLLTMAARKNKDDFFSNALDKANIQVGKMSRLISDFLDLSKMEAGKLQLNLSVFDIHALISTVIDDVKPLAGRHLITFMPGEITYVYADSEKIDQVISNLLTNAIKYSPDGGDIAVYTLLKAGKIRVCIRDRGIGIKKEEQQLIFKRFYRANTNTNSFSGFGIGLYLSAEIINRHQGEIGVESNPGHGAVFYFELPVEVIKS